MKAAILGTGSWATAFGRHLCHKWERVVLWGIETSQVDSINRTGTNPDFLPGVELPPTLRATSEGQIVAPAALAASSSTTARSRSASISRTPRPRHRRLQYRTWSQSRAHLRRHSNARPHDAQIFSSHLHADGRYAKELWAEAPSQTYDGPRITPELLERGAHYPQMNGKLVFGHASRRMPEAIHEALEFNALRVEDVNWFIPHQANIRMFQNIAKSLNVPFERFYVTLHKYGNISSASCAISLDEAVRDGSIKSDDLICLPVFGGGLTWGSALIRW